MWDLPGPGIELYIGRRILNHCATREAPVAGFEQGWLPQDGGDAHWVLYYYSYYYLSCTYSPRIPLDTKKK